jgi:hypothetical protein
MKLLTVGARGTDVILAALRLGRHFSLADLREGYGAIRSERGDVLPKEWKQGVSNELHRRSSDFSQFSKEGHQLDLIARVGSGQYCFRDGVRPKLLDAANEHNDLIVGHNTLVVPVPGEDVVDVVASHVIGKYAQQKMMEIMRSRGYTVTDTSARRAYDFTFCGRDRWSTTQTMECKGTRRADGAFAVTHNEMQALAATFSNYWFGVVYNISIVDGKASGGEAFITEPPIFNKWRITKGFKLQRISEATPSVPAEAHLL